MAQTMTAKIFMNGASQAVRLPMEFRFDATEVYVSRDEATGDVVLSTRPGASAWAEFFRSARSAGNDATEFMVERPMNQLPVEKDLFSAEDKS